MRKKNPKSCKEKLKNQTKNIKISYLINNTTIGDVLVDIMLLRITKLPCECMGILCPSYLFLESCSATQLKLVRTSSSKCYSCSFCVRCCAYVMIIIEHLNACESCWGCRSGIPVV